MDHYRQQIEKILREARGDSDADVALLEEAARVADLHVDIECGVKTRLRLISTGSWSGNHESALAAFTWCLAQIDQNDVVRAKWETNLLWYFKWIVENLSDYTEVSRAQLEHTLADMADRYTRGGHGLSAVYKSRAYVSLRLGDVDAHHNARQMWTDAPQGEITTCVACQTDSHAKFDLELGELDAAISAAEPIIAGRQTCKAIPCITFGRLLLPALQLGKTEVAKSFHARSFRQTMSNREYLDSAGFHCAYLALTGNIPKALSVFETAMAWAMIQKRAWERVVFFECAIPLFAKLAQSGDESIKLRIPQSAPFHREDHAYAPSQIHEGLLQMHQKLIASYNSRNGNTYMQQRYDRFRDMTQMISNEGVT